MVDQNTLTFWQPIIGRELLWRVCMVERDVGSVHHEIAELNPTLETFQVHFPDHPLCIPDIVSNYLDGQLIDIVRIERRVYTA